MVEISIVTLGMRLLYSLGMRLQFSSTGNQPIHIRMTVYLALSHQLSRQKTREFMNFPSGWPPGDPRPSPRPLCSCILSMPRWHGELECRCGMETAMDALHDIFISQRFHCGIIREYTFSVKACVMQYYVFVHVCTKSA